MPLLMQSGILNQARLLPSNRARQPLRRGTDPPRVLLPRLRPLQLRSAPTLIKDQSRHFHQFPLKLHLLSHHLTHIMEAGANPYRLKLSNAITCECVRQKSSYRIIYEPLMADLIGLLSLLDVILHHLALVVPLKDVPLKNRNLG